MNGDIEAEPVPTEKEKSAKKDKKDKSEKKSRKREETVV